MEKPCGLLTTSGVFVSARGVGLSAGTVAAATAFAGTKALLAAGVGRWRWQFFSFFPLPHQQRF